tara:strand:+ start:1789 stop:2622 length:834 start_codon:yes stop_codon:yes gene_type:complete
MTLLTLPAMTRIPCFRVASTSVYPARGLSAIGEFPPTAFGPGTVGVPRLAERAVCCIVAGKAKNMNEGEGMRIISSMKAGLCALLMTALAVPVSAQGLRLSGSSSKSRAEQFARQTRLMDSRLAGQYQESARLQPGGKDRGIADIQLSNRIPAYRGRSSDYIPHARAAARKYGVPEDLFLRLVQQESGWNPRARSRKGATGLAQLMPGTAAKLGVNPLDPVQNLQGGARYLRMMYNQFGNWRLALAAYNAGPAAVAKYNGVPPYRETMNYVRVIAGS